MIQDVEQDLQKFKGTECLNLVVRLLELRREKHRDKLEQSEVSEYRGRAKEDKDLLRIIR
jgi:hypothetical protein